MPSPLAITLHALASEAASGPGPTIDLLGTQSGGPPAREGLELTLDVSSGAGSVVVETAPSATGPWMQAASFDGITGAPRQQKLAIAPVSRYVRVSWELADPLVPLEFAVSGASHVLYVLPSDAFSTVPDKALEDISPSDLARACIDTSGEAEGYFKRRYALPLVGWGGDVRWKLGQRVAFYALSRRGNQYDGPDETVRDNAKAAETWLMRVGAGSVHPDVTDSTPARSGSAARIYSRYGAGSGSSSCERRVGDEDC
jgi:phage gp36-like protein